VVKLHVIFIWKSLGVGGDYIQHNKDWRDQVEEVPNARKVLSDVVEEASHDFSAHEVHTEHAQNNLDDKRNQLVSAA
jgi:hypothetical protein